MEVPYFSLKKVVERAREAFIRSVNRWLPQYIFIGGKPVEDFERRWAHFCGALQAVGVSNGSDAIYIALKALGIGPGDEVITQGNAYNADVTAIMRTGATPRFADIDWDTKAIDPKAVQNLVNQKTKAILVVHLFGVVSELNELQGLGIPIVEDCAQAHGARLQGKVACFSFYPTKTLGAIGDAGAIVTNDLSLAEQMRGIRNLGQKKKNHHLYFGSTMRLDPIQALWLLVQMRYLKRDIKERQRLAAVYTKHLGSFTTLEQYYPHIFPIFVYDRDVVKEKLKEAGVQAEVHYPVPVYQQPFYHEKGPVDACPNAEWFCREELSLPFFIGLTRRQQEHVINVLT